MAVARGRDLIGDQVADEQGMQNPPKFTTMTVQHVDKVNIFDDDNKSAYVGSRVDTDEINSKLDQNSNDVVV